MSAPGVDATKSGLILLSRATYLLYCQGALAIPRICAFKVAVSTLLGLEVEDGHDGAGVGDGSGV